MKCGWCLTGHHDSPRHTKECACEDERHDDEKGGRDSRKGASV